MALFTRFARSAVMLGMPLLAPAPPLSYETPDLLEAHVVRKVMWRLIPFMVLLYLMNYLDRVNVSFAKKEMGIDLGFKDTVYGLGAGIFFVGYFIFEIPSNLMMTRFGARRWMARIMISWGLISSAMMFVRGTASFYALRLLLGLAEAGFFPGIVLYLTYWIPARQRAKAVALFMTSTALSGVVGAPLSGYLLGLRGAGLHGWQWLFVIEGVPSVLLGIAILFVFDDGPEKAAWLTDAERDWLTAKLESERGDGSGGAHRLERAFADPKVWILALVYATIMYGFYGINYWTASIVDGVTHGSPKVVGFLSAIPFLAAAIGMVFVGRWADRTGNRKGAVVAGSIVGAMGMGLAAATIQPAIVIGSLALAAVGIWGTVGPFWALPSQFLHGPAAAAGIALINSIGNLLGGFVGNYATGWLKDHTHDYRVGLLVNAGVLMTTALLIGALNRVNPKELLPQ